MTFAKSDADAIIKELEARGVTIQRACDECGHTDWGFELTAGAMPNVHQPANALQPQVTLGGGHEMGILRCVHCTAVRLFHLGGLQRKPNFGPP